MSQIAALLALMWIGVAGVTVPATAAEILHKVLASPLVEVGSDPDGCTPAVSGLGGPPVWQVELERFLLDGKALVENSRQPDLHRFPLCIADLPIAKNATVELPFVAHEGGEARTAGLVLRFHDPQDFYVVEADVLAGRVRLFRVLNGEYREIAAGAAALAVGKMQTLKIEAMDETFSVSLDGKRLFDAHDGGIVAAGRFGLWSKADNRTSFGDLFITVLD